MGYRMVAKVGAWDETSPTARAKNAREMGYPGLFSGAGFMWMAGAVLLIALVVLALSQFRGRTNNPTSAVPAQSEKSIAVLPFLDLTEGMKEEEFADGMTEELIDKLSKISGFRVPAPTATFYFKGKQVPVAEIAKALGVVYVLDGSMRKSSGRLRVAARLVRADSGFVIWTETYDRPFDDIIMVQDDIAGEVT